MAKHPGFKAVAAKIGKKSGIKNPNAVLAAGAAKDDPVRLRAIADYLERHQHPELYQ